MGVRPRLPSPKGAAARPDSLRLAAALFEPLRMPGKSRPSRPTLSTPSPPRLRSSAGGRRWRPVRPADPRTGGRPGGHPVSGPASDRLPSPCIATLRIRPPGVLVARRRSRRGVDRPLPRLPDPHLRGAAGLEPAAAAREARLFRPGLDLGRAVAAGRALLLRSLRDADQAPAAGDRPLDESRGALPDAGARHRAVPRQPALPALGPGALRAAQHGAPRALARRPAEPHPHADAPGGAGGLRPGGAGRRAEDPRAPRARSRSPRVSTGTRQ